MRDTSTNYKYVCRTLIKNNPINRVVSLKLRCDEVALKPTTTTSDFK